MSWFMSINCWCCCCCSFSRFDLSLSLLALEDDEGDTSLSPCESGRPVCAKLNDMLLLAVCWLLNWFSEAVCGGGSILGATLPVDAEAGLPRVLCKNRESSSRLRKSGSEKKKQINFLFFSIWLLRWLKIVCWNKKIKFFFFLFFISSSYFKCH